jgi:hypothetical protein
VSETRKTTTPEGIEVCEGQVWRDLDKRMRGRQVTVTRVDPINGLAYYEVPVKNRVRIDRLRRPFWELVKGAKP